MSSRKNPWVVTPDSQAGHQGARRVPDPVEGCIWIPLRNRRRQIVAYTLIDEQDAGLSWTAWHLRADGYAAGRLRPTHPHQGPRIRKTQLLHRVILQAPYGMEVDHINRNRLDSFGYELPFGKGKPFLSGTGGLAQHLIGGWQAQGITSLRTGLPFTVTATGNASNTQSGDRPDVIGNPVLSGGERSIDRWFDTAAFRRQAPFTHGNS